MRSSAGRNTCRLISSLKAYERHSNLATAESRRRRRRRRGRRRRRRHHNHNHNHSATTTAAPGVVVREAVEVRLVLEPQEVAHFRHEVLLHIAVDGALLDKRNDVVFHLGRLAGQQVAGVVHFVDLRQQDGEEGETQHLCEDDVHHLGRGDGADVAVADGGHGGEGPVEAGDVLQPNVCCELREGLGAGGVVAVGMKQWRLRACQGGGEEWGRGGGDRLEE